MLRIVDISHGSNVFIVGALVCVIVGSCVRACACVRVFDLSTLSLFFLYIYYSNDIKLFDPMNIICYGLHTELHWQNKLVKICLALFVMPAGRIYMSSVVCHACR